MDEDTKKALQIVKLLEHSTSQMIIQDYLHDNGLPKSFKNWMTLYDERIKPGLASGNISIDSLHELLEDVEEHGKQHVFLFKCDTDIAKKLIDIVRIEKIAKEEGKLTELNSYSLADLPDEPMLTNIRFESVDNENALVIKIIEKRESKIYVGEEFLNGYYLQKYLQEIQRGIISLRLRESGLLEVRIESHKGSSNYEIDLGRVRRLVKAYINLDEFDDLSLMGAMKYLTDNSELLKEEVRYTNSLYVDDDGYTMSLTAQKENASLSDSKGVKDSTSAFKSDKGYVDRMNFWIKKIASNDLNNDIHVLTTKLRNEFVLPAQCRKNDYEYVLRRLLELNS
jgi:hypothetical protein